MRPSRIAGLLPGSIALLLAALTPACRSELGVPADAQLDCTTGPCPAGWTCNTQIGRCIATGHIDTTAPALTSSPAVAPALISAGAAASMAFDVSEELRQPPRVTLQAGFDRALTLVAAASSGGHWVFRYLPVGDEPQGVDCPLRIDLEDLQGLKATGLAGGSMRFDFSPPALASLALTGSPARAGASLRLDFATTEPLAADPVVHLGGRRLARDPASTTAFVYTYTSDGSEPEGPAGLPITVDLADLAGNAVLGLPAATAIFDRTAPGLDGSALSPPAATAGTLVRVTFTASEELSADPQVLLGGLALDKGVQAGRSYTYGHVVAASDGQGSRVLTIALVDRAGNPSGALPAGTVVLDFTPPAVTGLSLCEDDGGPAPCAADLRTFSARPGHDHMKISFGLSEPAAVRVEVGLEALGTGGGPEGCLSADGLSWICRHLVTDPMAGTSPRVESTPVAISAADPAGNPVLESAFATLDFQPPGLAGTPYFERCDSYAPARVAPNDLWVKPVAWFAGPACPFAGCGLAGPVRVHFAIDEAGGLGPGGVALDDGTPLLLDTCQSTATQLVAVLATDGTPGDRRVVADLLDARGNRRTLDLGWLRLDHTRPPPPDSAVAGRIVYHRFPWGADATGGVKAAFVEGAPGSVAPGASVAVYDGPDPSRAAPVGRTQAGASGAFGAPPGSAGTFPIAVGDIPEVFAVQEDAAGNASPPALIWDAVWTATTGFKAPGSTVLNPHLFAAEPAWRASRDTPAQLEPPSPADLATRAGTSLSTEGEPDLRLASISPAIPGVRGDCAMAYDPTRAESLLFGGRWSIYAVGPVSGSDTWRFDGSSWSEVSVSSPPPGRSLAGLAHDGTRGRFVLFGGTGTSVLGDTWELDGSAWKRVCWPGCSAATCSCTQMPTPRYGPSTFFDPISGRVVLFGGQDASGARADTWAWDGVDWSPLAPAHSPPPASGAAVAVSPELGQALLFPGSGTWLWDGSDWNGSASLPPWGSGGTDLWWDPSDGAFHAYFAPSNLMSTWDGAAWSAITFPPRIGATWITTYVSGTCGAFDRERGAQVRFGGCVDGTCRTDYSATQNTALLSAGVIRQLAPATAPGARAQGTMADVPDEGLAWLAGGRSANRYAYQDNWTWDGTTWASDGGGAAFNGLFGFELAWVGSGHLARFGGDTTGGGSFPGSSAISTYVRTSPGWTFATWGGNFLGGGYAEPSVQSNRAATTDQAFAYDEVQGQAIYFRGEGAGTFAGQWVTGYAPWVMLGDPNGLLWTPLAPAASPPTVRGHRLAWCPGAGGLVLFGGADAGGVLSDQTWSWSWSTSSWAEIVPARRPPPRTQPVLFCDRQRAKLYAVGGQGPAGDLDDVWEFDGSTWAPRAPAERPAARRGASGAFLSSQGRGVLFGGEELNGFRGDTWTWDGGRDRRPAHVFHARFGFANAAPVALQSIGVSWDAGGLSFDGASAPVAGAGIHVWDRGIWRPTGSANASSSPGALSWSTATDPEWTAAGTALPARLRRLVSGPAQEVAFAAAPLGTNRDRSPAATVATRYAEVAIRYRLTCLPAGQPATSAPRCCSGTASAGACQ